MNELLYKTKKIKLQRKINNLKSMSIEETESLGIELDSIIRQEHTKEEFELNELLNNLERKIDGYNDYFIILDQAKFLKLKVINCKTKTELN